CDVLRVAKTGGTPEVVLKGMCGKLATIEGSVFLTDNLVSLADGAARLAYAGPQLVGDRDDIYFVGRSMIERASPGSRRVTRFARLHEATTNLVVDGEHLYWLEQNRFGSYDDSVVMRAKRACGR